MTSFNFRNLLPGQGGDEEDERTTFVFQVYGQTVVINWEEIIIGNPAGSHVRITADGVEIKDVAKVKGFWQTDGDFFLGSDVSAPDKTYLAIFAVAQTYNGESMGAGDFLIGDNSSGVGNMHYDASTNQFRIRGGTDASFFVDGDDGLFGAGGFNQRLQVNDDEVLINEAPIRILEVGSTPSTPLANSAANVYVKGDKLIIQWNESGTVRYKYLDLTGTGVTWVHTTTAP